MTPVADTQPLRAALAECLHEDEDSRTQFRAILGTESVDDVAAAFERLVERELSTSVEGCTYRYMSVGVTLELRLDDGRLCVLKAVRSDADVSFADGALRVQQHLADSGFPAPAVLVGPSSCLGAHVFILEALDRSEDVQYDAGIRDAMARSYARLIQLAETLTPRPTLRTENHVNDRLWSTPHSTLFDFEATADSAGYIDEVAMAARERLSEVSDLRVVAHTDWSLQNVAFRAGDLTGVFDWDSVAYVPEFLAVAGAAVFHAHDWREGKGVQPYFWAGPDWTMKFVEAYEAARDRPWAGDDRELLGAAFVSRLAYQARCQHAAAPQTVGPAAKRLLEFAQVVGIR